MECGGNLRTSDRNSTFMPLMDTDAHRCWLEVLARLTILFFTADVRRLTQINADFGVAFLLGI